jgi:hypothetical protein
LSGGACETSENGDVTVHQASIRICFNEYTFVYVIRGSDVPYSSRVSSFFFFFWKAFYSGNRDP